MTTVLIIYVLVLIPLALMVRTLSRTAYRWLFTMLHGIWLTLLTLSCANTYPLFLAEEAEALSLVSGLRQRLNVADIGDSLRTKDQFLLVDVSNDTQLLTTPQQRLWEQYPAITSGVDRRRLTSFLNLFNQDTTLLESTDLIVCDVLFDYPDDTKAVDVALLQSLVRLSQQSKLLLAESGQVKSTTDTPGSNTLIHKGLVDIRLHDGLFFSYRLIDRFDRVSLPYRIYQQLDRRQAQVWTIPGFGTWLEEASTDNSAGEPSKWGTNTFIPDLRLTDDDLQSDENVLPIGEAPELGSWLREAVSRFGRSESVNQGLSQLKYTVWELGTLLDKPYVLKQLLHHPPGTRTIVLIGAFGNDQLDVHQTAFGEMHGPLLLLNVYLNLRAGSHLLSGKYIAFLLLMFSLLSHQMLRKKITYQQDGLKRMLDEWHGWLKTAGNWPTERWNRRFVASVNRTVARSGWHAFQRSFPHTVLYNRRLRTRVKGIAGLVIEEVFLSKQPYWLLLITLAISALYFNHIINVMGLAIYIAAIDFSLQILKRPKHVMSIKPTLTSHPVSMPYETSPTDPTDPGPVPQ